LNTKIREKKYQMEILADNLPSRNGAHSCLRRWCGASSGGNIPLENRRTGVQTTLVEQPTKE